MQRVQEEMAQGKLGIARDRLRGLVHAYPLDLSLRSLLGEVNWRLGYPIEAGRWWFLEPDLDERQQEAIRRFLESCREDPLQVLRRLDLGFHPDQLENEELRSRIQAQLDECTRQGLARPTFEETRELIASASKAGILSGIACIGSIALLVILAIIGFISLVR